MPDKMHCYTENASKETSCWAYIGSVKLQYLPTVTETHAGSVPNSCASSCSNLQQTQLSGYTGATVGMDHRLPPAPPIPAACSGCVLSKNPANPGTNDQLVTLG